MSKGRLRADAAALIAGSLGQASPCYGAESRRQGGSTFLTLGATLSSLDLGLRAGLEYRWPDGPGFAVAVGTSLLMDFVANANITGEALAILPLFKLGRSGTLDLALGAPSLMYAGELINSSLIFSVGGTARLRFALGSRWSLFVRAGGGYPFTVDSTGLHADAIDPTLWLRPDLQIGALFRL